MASKSNSAPSANKDTYSNIKDLPGVTIDYDQGDPAFKSGTGYRRPDGGLNSGYGTSAPKNTSQNKGDAPFFKHTITGKQ